MAKENGYIGRIPNSGTATVQAPNQTVPPKHSNVQKGKDLKVSVRRVDHQRLFLRGKNIAVGLKCP